MKWLLSEETTKKGKKGLDPPKATQRFQSEFTLDFVCSFFDSTGGARMGVENGVYLYRRRPGKSGMCVE